LRIQRAEEESKYDILDGLKDKLFSIMMHFIRVCGISLVCAADVATAVKQLV